MKVSKKTFAALCAMAVLAGIALRLRIYQLDFSLWLDESSLALNILPRSFLELAKPLAYLQAAPIFFLWMVKGVTIISHSSSELALRFLPFVSSIASCICFWALCRNFQLSYAATLAALTLFSVSGRMIEFSWQAKQYSTDILTAILIYLAASAILRNSSPRTYSFYAISGLAAIGLSHPSIFILAGVGITFFVDCWMRGDRRGMIVHSSIGALWLSAFLCEYVLLLRRLGDIPGMRGYWEKYAGFMPLSSAAPRWLYDAFIHIANMAGYQPFILLGAASVGGLYLWWKNWRIPAMILIPIALAMAASGVHGYPFVQRMILFTIPGILILAGAGFGIGAAWRPWILFPAAAALFCHLIFGSLKSGVALFTHPERFGKEEFKYTFTVALNSHRCPDHIFIHERAANHYRYYNRFRWNRQYNFPLLFSSQLAGRPADRTPRMSGYLAEPTDNEPAYFDSPPCFWIVTADLSPDELAEIHQNAAKDGYQEVSIIERIGSKTFLFTRSGGAAAH